MEDDGLLHRVYERRLAHSLDPDCLPRHIGVIVDGNRRWAKASGASTAEGHRQGAAKITEFLEWCEEMAIPLVTIWMLSTDNLSRPAEELASLHEIIADAVAEHTAAGYAVRIAGSAHLLPDAVQARIQAMIDAAEPRRSLVVNLAIGYGGRQEIVDAVREIIRAGAAEGLSVEEIAETVSIDAVSEHLYTRGQPDPDLIIRTSGEQRMSGFLLWQSVHSEYWFCETYWPGFRRTDFLRALRDYCRRERRFGS